MRLIFATNNENKIKEIRHILGKRYADVVFSLKDLNLKINPDEIGNSFAENANIKSMAVYNELKYKNMLLKNDYVIADDTGLCIDFLDGAPGIMSARYMGKETLQEEKNKKIIELMKNVDENERNAYFITIISVVTYNGEIINFDGKINGKIATKIAGNSGFGYDSIFEINGITYSEMGENAKNKISHRSIALTKFIEYLEKK